VPKPTWTIFKRFEQWVIVDAARRYLGNDADVENQHRKKLRANPVASWELRFGKYRVFYELLDVTTVKVVWPLGTGSITTYSSVAEE
jgi:hypothetical protein